MPMVEMHVENASLASESRVLLSQEITPSVSFADTTDLRLALLASPKFIP